MAGTESAASGRPAAAVGRSRLEAFFLRELPALGATQLVAGMVQVTFGTPLVYTANSSMAGQLGTGWWAGAWSLVSGAMMVSLRNHLEKPWVLASLLVICLNILTSGAGFALYILSLSLLTPPDDGINTTKTAAAITGTLVPYAFTSGLISLAVSAPILKHLLRS